ncbi:hypothetical protein BCR39DRAFT_161745 [Naematelia encephala]|uniref:NmrA-like domain-containing protein n=1 Tax=Naematelia encephala TaxID=71784 RepID=A0A1Y2B4U7_9TREE|nr:hypothetical protein BCR39DRAFT_161745 [Naematelia encephala]
MALPLVAVVGALGTQGGSVVQALSKSGSFRARALTRNTESEKALRLKALQNVDLVRFDANDPALVKLAFDGADYVFAMTAEGEDETANGKLMIEVALHVGIKFFVFSSLPDPSPYVVPFFSKKHAVSQFLFDSVLPGCGIMLPFFMENFLDMGWIQKGEDGVVDLKFIRVPETKSSEYENPQSPFLPCTS